MLGISVERSSWLRATVVTVTSADISPSQNSCNLLSNDDPRVRLGPYRIRGNNPLPREMVSPENCGCPHFSARQSIRAFVCIVSRTPVSFQRSRIAGIRGQEIGGSANGTKDLLSCKAQK